MHISVILCTKDNADRLRVTLEAFRQCAVPANCRWELIVVANACRDNTVSVAECFSGELPIRVITEPTPGLSRARNAGISNSLGEFLLFCDDDIFPSVQWIASYFHAVTMCGDTAFYGGPVLSVFESEPVSTQLLRIAPWSVRGFDLGPNERELHSGESFLSANWCCKKSLILNAGGFDESLGLGASSGVAGEETDLQHRLMSEGIVGVYMPKASIGHFVPASKCTIAHIVERIEASALASYYGKKSPSNMPRIFGRPRWMVRRVLEQWLRWRLMKVYGGDWMPEYIAYRITRAIMRAEKTSSRS